MSTLGGGPVLRNEPLREVLQRTADELGMQLDDVLDMSFGELDLATRHLARPKLRLVESPGGPPDG